MEDSELAGDEPCSGNSPRSAVFVSRVNPVAGKLEWLPKDEEYDYEQEVARSAYADMLHDTERNELYERALEIAIQSKHSASERAVVLDIGTGTGLLSMMAVRHGADAVYACDAFPPAVRCARRIIASNRMSERIVLIEKRSTDLAVPQDLPERANILVTEVFDTELIGEGAIGTFRHALENILTLDCIVIPSSARLYIQPVISSFLFGLNRLSVNLPADLPVVNVPPDLEFCNSGLASPLLDLQLSELPVLGAEESNPPAEDGYTPEESNPPAEDGYTPLVAPVEVLQFDFCGRVPLPVSHSTLTPFTSLRSGLCTAFLMWWDLSMDMKGDIVLSCRPRQHCLGEKYEPPQWRDHWMQAVYFPHKPRPLLARSKYLIKSEHDEYSLCFDVGQAGEASVLNGKDTDNRSDVALQMAFCRLRLSMGRQSSVYRRALEDTRVKGATVLCISDGSFLPFLAARLNASKVLVVESNFSTRRVMQRLIDYNSTSIEGSTTVSTTNNLSDIISLYDDLQDIPIDIKQRISLVIGEPYFYITSLPWHDLQLWYSATSLYSSSNRPAVLPRASRLCCLAIQFENLHRIRSPLINKQGFDLRLYDNMIEEARERADEFSETHGLWEYPGVALSERLELCYFNFSKTPKEFGNRRKTIKLPVTRSGELNGVAFWMEYDLSDSTTDKISYGLLNINPNTHKPEWNKYYKQGVHLPAKSHSVSPHTHLSIDFRFHCQTADITLSLGVLPDDIT